MLDEASADLVSEAGERFTTPAGKPASSISFMKMMAEVEVNSDGFTTTVFPAAKAGASFQAKSRSGEFHGMISAQMPSGSCRV